MYKVINACSASNECMNFNDPKEFDDPQMKYGL